MFEICYFFDSGVSEKAQSEKIKDTEEILECITEREGKNKCEASPEENNEKGYREGKAKQFFAFEEKYNTSEYGDTNTEQS